MALSNDLISQFVKVNKTEKPKNVEETHNATAVVEHDGTTYVRIDGSELLTPVTSTVVVENEDRVRVAIKNHSATIVSNVSTPSASSKDVAEIGSKVTEFEIVVADKVSTKQLDAQIARIDSLQSENVTITDTLTAQNGVINNLLAKDVEIDGKLTANEAAIDNLEATKLSADIADVKYATIENLEATNQTVVNIQGTYAEFEETVTKDFEAVNARIDNIDASDITVEQLDARYAQISNLEATDAKVTNLEGELAEFDVLVTNKFAANDAAIDDLEANKISATDIEGKFANIDFSNIGKAAIEFLFAQSGLIKDLVVGDGTITGELVGVTISGDLIEGNTIVAEKLVIKGTDGLYYKLNTDGVTTEAEQTDYNSINGSVIKAKSITATKINVSDLVAFDATIGGFNITDTAIYSGVKESVDNTTRGIYQDKNGQFAVGDATNFLKYYKDTDGTYKLAISADSIKLTSGDKDIAETIEEITNLQVGARNLIQNSETLVFNDYSFGDAVSISFLTDNDDSIFVDENNNLFIF